VRKITKALLAYGLTLLTILPQSNYATDLSIKQFKSAHWLNPIAINKNPYSKNEREKIAAKLAKNSQAFCGIKFYQHHKSYRLKTIQNKQELLASGYQITHKSACGVCSSLQDLAVYLANPNLTQPVRRCGRWVWFPYMAKRCLKKIGFSHACIHIWYDNMLNTAKQCGFTCLKSWLKNEPFNLANGKLNTCLACDEIKSGPVFKVVAGRTRRNSGIISAIHRPQSQVYPVTHHYD
jgi:hypothetical protein